MTLENSRLWRGLFWLHQDTLGNSQDEDIAIQTGETRPLTITT